MSDLEQKRQAGCEGKERFTSAKLSHAVRTRRGRPGKPIPPRVAYHCKFCGGYHLGTQSKPASSKPKVVR
jgi:hypothetical protein